MLESLYNFAQERKIAQERKKEMKERFFIEGKTDGSFSLWDNDRDGWGTRKVLFNSRSYETVQRLFIECREKFVGKKVDIDAVL